MSTIPAGAAIEQAIGDAALAYARKWKAIDDEGRVRCIRCNYRPGTLPSLCCMQCLEARREGK